MPEFTSSINNFVSRVLTHDKIAAPNRYWVDFIFPRMSVDFTGGGNTNVSRALQNQTSGTVNNQFNNMGQLSMMCTTASMPGREMLLSEHKHENYPVRIAISQSYSPITFSFTLSQNLKERRFFELWQDVVVNIKDGTMNFYDEYISTIKIYQLDKNNNATYGVELRDAYPTSISEVAYTYAANNEILTSSVTISYRYWKNINDDKLYNPTL